jgi:hypothetical protein
MFAIKAAVSDPRAETYEFSAQKTMYGGKEVAAGDTIFIFASENEGGNGLVASGVVTSASAVPRIPGVARQTPRVNVVVRRTALAERQLGRRELRPFSDWGDGPTRDRAQLQVLSSGDQQSRRRLGHSGGVPRQFLSRRVRMENWVTSPSVRLSGWIPRLPRVYS